MKTLFAILSFSLLMMSCASEKPWYEKAERFHVSSKTSNYFAPKGSTENYAMDSTLFDKMLDNGSSEVCAMISAYSMSEVELERQLPNRCHSQYFSFQNCRAVMEADTLRLIFETKNPRRSMVSNKIMKINILGEDHHAEIIHGNKELMEVILIDGSTEIRQTPRSEVVDSRLKLNKRTYSPGDTIIGEIKLSSYQLRGRRKVKIKEFVEGRFRTIIGGQSIACEEKLLVQSLLD